jgi:hypothetical protein
MRAPLTSERGGEWRKKGGGRGMGRGEGGVGREREEGERERAKGGGGGGEGAVDKWCGVKVLELCVLSI